jgi:dienelactone hydrolase
MTQPIHYKDLVFPAVTVERNLTYVEGQRGRAHLFDLYESKQDTTALRPLIIWMHGGGFKFGSKDQAGIKLWSKTFAERGYVAVAINYRLGRKNFSFSYTDLVKNCYNAVQDLRRAILFFKSNYARFGIDTSRIVVAGNSAGGITALQAVYSREDGGGADRDSIAAIVNFWGGIFNPDWLQQARVPIVSVHGKKDNIVNYDHKGYPLYGGYAIHKKADSLGIPNRLKLYDDYSHELQKHFNPLFAGAGTKKRWLEAGQFAADFLYEELWGGGHAGGGAIAGGQQK